MKTERYFSVDIESAGPIPGKYAKLSLGACVVGNPEERFYVELKPISKEFVPDALKISGFDGARWRAASRSHEGVSRHGWRQRRQITNRCLLGSTPVSTGNL